MGSERIECSNFPVPVQPEEVEEKCLEITRILAAYPERAEFIKSLAFRIKKEVEVLDPVIQEMTNRVCPGCRTPQCTNKNGRFDLCDLVYLISAGLRVPFFEQNLDEKSLCQFLGDKGCILERNRRPHRCNWWYCQPLLEIIFAWPPRKQRRFFSLTQGLSQIRMEMFSSFMLLVGACRI